MSALPAPLLATQRPTSQPSRPRERSELPPLPRHADDFSPGGRRWVVGLVVLAHGAMAWGLLRMSTEPTLAPVETAPIMVSWIAPPAATPAPPQPSPPKPQPTPVKVTPQPRHVIAAAPTPTPTPAPTFTAPEPAPEPHAASQDTSGSNGQTPSNAAPAAPPAAPPGPQMVSASALRYLILPHQVYPMASRHLRESGIVYVKVVVDVNGMPKSVTIHKSSGFQRLDNQALEAMREARFQPYRVNGQPVESMAIAPLAYELQ